VLQVTDEQPSRAVGQPALQLGNRRPSNVQPDEVEAPGEQGQEVAAVATADVQAARPGQPEVVDCGQDVADERHRRLVDVAAATVLGVPRLGDPVALHR